MTLDEQAVLDRATQTKRGSIMQKEYSVNDVVIRCEGVSKRYAVGNETATVSAWRKAANVMLCLPMNYSPGGKPEEFWALRDITFHAKCGETIGVIGPNGGGKSTLLRILAKLDYPTGGDVVTVWRTNYVLETPNLFRVNCGKLATGRDNVVRAGKAVEMKKREIEAKVKEIAEFAGLEPFMDIPVNHYSCGMAMRLEFAIATHFPCDILLVDDKLEACDPEFRRKCIYKMESLSRDGATVIFASHNMQTVERLCRLCIVIRNGRIAFIGSTARAIKDTRGLE